MADTIESRCFPNPIAEAEARGEATDKSAFPPVLQGADGGGEKAGGGPSLTHDTRAKIIDALRFYSSALVGKGPPDQDWCRPGCCSGDRGGGPALYIGKPGLDLALLQLKTQADAGSPLEGPLRDAQWFLPEDGGDVPTDPQQGGSLSTSFICGPAGVWYTLAMRCLMHPSSSSQSKARTSIERFLTFATHAAERSDADEWLYGRAGFVVALLLLHQQLHRQQDQQLRGLANTVEELTNKTAEAIIASGLRTAQAMGDAAGPPLRYAFSRKEFVGAAHGYFCILYALLVTPSLRNNPSHAAHKSIKETLHWLLQLEDSHHNYPTAYHGPHTSSHQQESPLVYFCHGAPGAVLLFAEAYDVYHDEVYKKAGERAAACTWRYGMLRKGPGLCHGVAGNGYALLRWYQLSRQQVWLERAVRFACEVNEDRQRQIKRDHPYSLFEGHAGVCCFLSDLLHDPMKARMPVFGI
ncbi:hypothetical protein ACSSS7_006889 [Eimeria intestinalis]